MKNIALDKPTYQKSTMYTNRGGSWVAVSENVHTYFAGSGHCTHTMAQETQWWMVDIGAISAIKQVVIHHRVDICNHNFCT